MAAFIKSTDFREFRFGIYRIPVCRNRLEIQKALWSPVMANCVRFFFHHQVVQVLLFGKLIPKTQAIVKKPKANER
jgi:hypothetical protein